MKQRSFIVRLDPFQKEHARLKKHPVIPFTNYWQTYPPCWYFLKQAWFLTKLGVKARKSNAVSYFGNNFFPPDKRDTQNSFRDAERSEKSLRHKDNFVIRTFLARALKIVAWLITCKWFALNFFQIEIEYFTVLLPLLTDRKNYTFGEVAKYPILIKTT